MGNILIAVVQAIDSCSEAGILPESFRLFQPFLLTRGNTGGTVSLAGPSTATNLREGLCPLQQAPATQALGALGQGGAGSSLSRPGLSFDPNLSAEVGD